MTKFDYKVSKPVDPFRYLEEKFIKGKKMKDAIDPHKELDIRFARGSKTQFFLSKGRLSPEEYILQGDDVTIYIE